MARRRGQRRKTTKERLSPPIVSRSAAVVAREALRVEQLAYTRTQAAQALGISRSTFNRTVLPVLETVDMPSGRRLVPIDELERLLAERRQRARAEPKRPRPRGRKTGLSPLVIARIRDERARGKSLGEIARTLNADGVRTSQGARQWWPSTVRSVLARDPLGVLGRTRNPAEHEKMPRAPLKKEI